MVTIEFIAYHDIQHLTPAGRIRKLLNIAKEHKIALVEGRLKKDEEMELIRTTMEEINPAFKGIELAVITPKSKNLSTVQKIKFDLMNLLVGETRGFTVLGPATVVKAIKQNPNKIVLYTRQAKAKRKKR